MEAVYSRSKLPPAYIRQRSDEVPGTLRQALASSRCEEMSVLAITPDILSQHHIQLRSEETIQFQTDALTRAVCYSMGERRSK